MKEKKEEDVYRITGGKTILKNGQEWTLSAQTRAAENKTR